MICPVLRGIGEKHVRTHAMVEVGHVLSRSVSEALTAVLRPAGDATVLLACADDEQHSLPLEALAAALAETGRRRRRPCSRPCGAPAPAAWSCGHTPRPPPTPGNWSGCCVTAPPRP